METPSEISLPSQQWLNVLPDALILVDREGRIVMLNDIASEMFGYQREELISKPLTLLIPEHFRASHADLLRDYFRNPAARPMGSGLSFTGRRKDGTQVRAEISLGPMVAAGQRLACAVIRNIAERARAEMELREREALLDRIFNSATDMLVLFRVIGNDQFIVESQNLAASSYLRKLGKDAREFIGKDAGLVLEATGLSEAEIEERRSVYRKVAREKMEAHLIRMPGPQPDAIEIWVSPVVDREGHCTHILSSARVVTDRVRAEMELREREERLRLVFNAHQDLQIIFRIEPDGRIVNESFNKAEVDSLKRFVPDPGAFLERAADDLMRALGFPEYVIADLLAKWRHVAATKMPLYSEVKSTAAIPDVIEATLLPILGPDGECRRLLWTGHVVTERARADEELRKRERELEEAQSIGHIGSWTWDFAEDRVAWSDEVYRILGYEPQQFPAMHLPEFLELVHPDDRELVSRSAWAGYSDLSPHDFEHRIVRPDGTVRVVRSRSRIQFDSSGQPVRMVATIHDITEERQAAAREAQRLLQLEKLAELSMMLSGDPATVLARIVRMIGDLFGVRSVCLAEIEGSHLVFRAAYADGKVTQGGGRFPLEDSPCATVAASRDIRAYERVRELFPRAADLGGCDAFAWCGFPSLDSEGNVVAVTGLADDKPHEFSTEDRQILRVIGQRIAAEFDRGRRLAEQARMQERLRENQRILEEAEQMAHLGSYYSSDVSTGEMTWSRELYRIYEVDPSVQNLGPEIVLSRTHPEDRALVQEQQRRFSSQAGHFEMEHRLQMPDGRIKHVLVQGSTNLGPAGELQMRGTVQDITERKRAEQERAKLQAQLMQAQRLESIGRLAGGVAHDFNNMLTVIRGYAGLTQGALPKDSKLWHNLSEIIKAANRSQEITQKLLGFSRQQIIAPVPSNLNDLVADLQEPLGRLIGEDIELSFHPGRDLWTVAVDHSQVNQILLNLVVNARDAMPQGGKLTIETENVHISEEDCRLSPEATPGTYVQLSVSDSGVGMDEETASHIFEPFFTTKAREKGTGLGLATVYGIIKQNEGFVTVLTEPGQGTTFKLYFPAAEGAVGAVAPGPGAGTIAAGHETILLVEDDELVRNMTKCALEEIGYKPLVAASPQEAIELCSQKGSEIRLMLTDVVMKGMNGMELRDRISALNPSIKVLFMSGYASNVIVQHGILKKGLHFIQKPFAPDDLARRIEELLAGNGIA